MVYRGQVSGEVIVLAGGVRLPEGCQVLVEPVTATVASAPTVSYPTRNGVPVFPSQAAGTQRNLELVNELRDEAP